MPDEPRKGASRDAMATPATVRVIDDAARRRIPSPGALRPLLPRVRPHAGKLSVAGVTLILSAIAGLAFPQVVRYLLDAAFVARDGALLDRIAIGLVVLFAVQGVLNYAQVYALSATGELVIARLRADLVAIEIADDGRGVDWERVRVLAQSRGLPASDRADLCAALLAPNLSTRDRVTDTSGRGIGLGAVDGEVKALGGSLSVLSECGQGCTWVVTIPAVAIGAVGALSSDSERRLRLSDRPARASASA